MEISQSLIALEIECPAEFLTTGFQQNSTEFFPSAEIKSGNSVKFRKIRILPELFFDGVGHSSWKPLV